MPMTLAQFALAVGAGPKWVQNAVATLDLRFTYSEAEARVLGLARVIQATSNMPLRRAYAIAEDALASPTAAKATVVAEAPDGSVQVSVDVPRYLSTFSARVALAGKQRGRVRERPAKSAGGPIQAAREYGIDISLLESNLRRSPEQRLRLASANSDFIRGFRGKAAR